MSHCHDHFSAPLGSMFLFTQYSIFIYEIIDKVSNCRLFTLNVSGKNCSEIDEINEKLFSSAKIH